MKKRLLSLLLTVCLTVAMFSVLGTAASAADDKITGYLTGYTMQAGDTIYSICQDKGIDFNMNINKILTINGITNANWLYPGTRLWLPTSSADTSATYYSLLAHVLLSGETPASLCQSYGIDYNSNLKLLSALNTNLNNFIVGQTIVLPLQVNPVGTVTPSPAASASASAGASATPAATAAPTGVNGDTLSYYLAQHVLQYGETVSGICAAMGVDFGKYSDTILRINRIASYNYLLPGQTLLIPATSVPAGSYYKVMAHTVVAGDTVYNLCASYGLNFGTYQAMIQNLNNTNNLAGFYVGQTLYMPLYVANGAGGTVVSPSASPKASASASAAPAASAAPVAEPTGDTLSYYLAAHVLKAGETVTGICAELGVDFNSLQNKIASLSGITNYSYLLPGKTILIPMNKVPSGAYYKVMAHTVQAGDTVYNLCASYGLNYFTYSSLIQALNSTTNLTSFYVGQTLYLPLYVGGTSTTSDPAKTTPAPGNGTITGTITAVTGSTFTVNGIVFGYKGASLEGAALVGSTATVTYNEANGVYSATKVVISKSTASTSASPSAGTATPTPKIEIPEGDTLSYYLANHVIQAGETVSGVCAGLGVDFNALQDRILKLSNIQNFNNVKVGQTIRIPMTTVPTTSYYKIMAHTLVAGDTMYDLAVKYGLNYNTSLDFLQRLNNTTNLANFYVGQTVYLPLYVQVG